ncbi:DUF202 domain-containing protein [Nocardioides sp. SLBN-35]|uniref:DUF202 domain-containing protein n=1 Tax=Nocardioides sp. SLBN-35 TaxID=2768445 RepID=UPI00116D2088|nr:DUF202 domain-containing protein [Nocardioides sp. SLBN-35]TQK70293.1 uncharacterized protein DUF202 [Nocardioides sp. SLBN-35]
MTGTQTERTRLAWTRSVLSMLGVVVVEVRVLLAVDGVVALLVLAVGVLIAAAALAGVARRHPRRRPGGGLRRDLDGRLPAMVAALAGLVGLGSLVLVLG